MWRLQLFLLLSTCFLIPYEAKPTTTIRPIAGSTAAAATSTTTTTLATSLGTTMASVLASTLASPTAAPSTAPNGNRSHNIGRLAAKDLADLLMASMQARNVKLTSSQEATVRTLREMEPQEQQSGAVMLQLGMDVIIDVLIGSSTDASCERVIKDIKHSKDKNSLTLSLKSFQALCTFNNITCSQKQVVQIIKSTVAFKQSDTAVAGARSTRTALTQASTAQTDIIKGDRDSIVSFLQARKLSELSAICGALLQVCGASPVEAQNIVKNLIEMGPKDNGKSTGTNILQTNGFSTLIVSLMDSLTSIANGNKSGFCAATPDSWIVRLLNMGVAKVVIMGLLTALDRTVPPSPNALIEQSIAAKNLVDADQGIKSSKGAPTSKRASGLFGNLVGNEITRGGTLIDGNNNSINKLVDVGLPVLVAANALNSVTGVASGATGSSAAGTLVGSASQLAGNNIQNAINSGGKTIVGNNNSDNRLVAANVPVLAQVNALNTLTGAANGASSSGTSSGAGDLLSGVTSGGSGLGGLVGTVTGVVGDVTGTLGGVTGALDGVTGTVGGVLGGVTGTLGGVTGALDGVTGTLDGTLGGVTGAVGGVVGTVTGVLGGVLGGGSSSSSSSGSSSGLLSGVTSGDGSTSVVGNDISNTINQGGTVIQGNDNKINKLVDANIPVVAGVNLLNSVTGIANGGSSGGLLSGVTGGALGGGSGGSNIAGNNLQNGIDTGSTVISGSGNSINKLVDANVPVVANVNALNTLLGSASGGSGSGGLAGGLLGGSGGGLLGGGSAGNGGSSAVGNNIANGINGGSTVIDGNNNSINKLVDANIPVVAGVNLLNSVSGIANGGSSGGLLGGVTGGVLGGGSGASSIAGNNIQNGINTGSTVIDGNGNSINKLVDANVPVLANVNALNTLVGSATGGSGSGGLVGGLLGGSGGGLLGGGSAGSSTAGNNIGNQINAGSTVIDGNNNSINKLVDANIPVVAGVNLLNSVTGIANGGSGAGGLAGGLLGGSGGGLLGGGSAGNNIGNGINQGSTVIKGQGNSINKLLDVGVPILANVNLLNNVLGSITGISGKNVPPQDRVEVVNPNGQVVMQIAHPNSNPSVAGNRITNTINQRRQIIMGNNNRIFKLVNLDLSVLASLNLANSIIGSSSVCNSINSSPKTVIKGNNNDVTTVVDLDVSAIASLNLLNSVIGKVGQNCPPVTPPPPTPSPPTPSPPTPSPPTPPPPTRPPPTPYPPGPYPPTPFPPTPFPPTPFPPTPNPNNCYRRYCRKWRTRPSYLCYKNCGGSYVYRP